jgi:hypothetical protein
MDVNEVMRYGNDEDELQGQPQIQLEEQSFISSIRMNQSTMRPT